MYQNWSHNLAINLVNEKDFHEIIRIRLQKSYERQDRLETRTQRPVLRSPNSQ